MRLITTSTQTRRLLGYLDVAETHIQEAIESAVFWHGQSPAVDYLEHCLSDLRTLRLELRKTGEHV